MLGGSVEGQRGLASRPGSTSAFLHTELLHFDSVIASYSSVEFITRSMGGKDSKVATLLGKRHANHEC